MDMSNALYDDKLELADPKLEAGSRKVDNIMETTRFASNDIQTIGLIEWQTHDANLVTNKGVERCPDIGLMTHFESPWDGQFGNKQNGALVNAGWSINLYFITILKKKVLNLIYMKILIIAAHPDDEILGIGGSIAKWAASGNKVDVKILAEGSTSRDLKRDSKLRQNDILNLRSCADKVKYIGSELLANVWFPR